MSSEKPNLIIRELVFVAKKHLFLMIIALLSVGLFYWLIGHIAFKEFVSDKLFTGFIPSSSKAQNGKSQVTINGYIIQFKEKPVLKIDTFKFWQDAFSQKREIEKRLKTEKLPEGLAKSFQQVQKRMNQLQVQLKQHKQKLLSDHANALRDIEKKIGKKKILRQYTNVLNAVSLDISKNEAEIIRKLDYVENIYPNLQVQAFLTDSVPQINADDVWSLSYTGQGQKIAIIDTGIDYTHSDLGGCFGSGCKVIGGYDIVNNDSDPMDDNGHGTHCAGIAAANGILKGVAPDARLYAYKVLDSGGFGWWDWAITGIERAVDPNQDGDYSDQVDVISMSLGGSGDPDDVISQAVDNAVEAGVVVAIAAGNWGPNNETIASPGTARMAITVGSVQKNDIIPDYSSRGPTSVGIKPDLVAPGGSGNLSCNNCDPTCCRYPEGINSSVSLGELWNCWGSQCGNEQAGNKYIKLSGTSMAAPHVAGAAALIKQAHPDWSPEEIKMALRNTSIDLGYDIYTQGYGGIDVLKAVETTRPSVAVLYNPVKIHGASFDVQGTVIGDSFTLYYTEGENPQSVNWTEACKGNFPNLENTTLCQWNIGEAANGEYTLKLVVEKASQESIDFGFIDLQNSEINYPKDLDDGYDIETAEVFPAWKEIEIKGTAAGFGFDHYTIEWCKDGICNNNGISLANNGSLPIAEGILGKWNSSFITESNFYYLKLTTYYSSRQNTGEVKIYVDSTLQYGWPRKIDIEDGSSGAYSVINQPTIADIDNDKKNDLIFAYGKYIYVFKHDGSNLAGWPKEIKTSCSYDVLMQIGPAAADLDKDSYNEIVVCDNCGYLHILDHDGNYLSQPKLFGSYIDTVSIADINQDNNLEIIFGDWSGYLHAVDINGNYLQGFPKYFPMPDAPNYAGIHQAVNMADLDVDGYKELAVVSWGCKKDPCNLEDEVSKIYLLNYKGEILNNGWPKDFERRVEVILGDVNNDNKIEIIAATTKGIYIFSTDGSVVDFIPIENVVDITEGGFSIGDINKDGKIEIVVLAQQAVTQEVKKNYLHLFEKKEGAWEEPVGFPVFRNWPQMQTEPAGHPMLGNLDSDQIENEISVIAHGGQVLMGDLPNYYAFNLDGSVVEGFPKKIADFGLGNGAPIGDLDDDGDNELILYTWSGNIYVWDLPGKSGNDKWSMFQHDPQHTGLYPLNLLLDQDKDGIPDTLDNCPAIANSDQKDSYPPLGNRIGNACDCEADFDCNGDVGIADTQKFLRDFGRNKYNRPCTNISPCYGDFDCDGDVDADDTRIFTEDSGRNKYNRPCPACVLVGNWCVY